MPQMWYFVKFKPSYLLRGDACLPVGRENLRTYFGQITDYSGFGVCEEMVIKKPALADYVIGNLKSRRCQTKKPKDISTTLHKSPQLPSPTVFKLPFAYWIAQLMLFTEHTTNKNHATRFSK